MFTTDSLSVHTSKPLLTIKQSDINNRTNTYIEYDCFSKERHIPGREHEDVDYARRNNKSNSGIRSSCVMRDGITKVTMADSLLVHYVKVPSFFVYID